jgi:hypothetical protein
MNSGERRIFPPSLRVPLESYESCSIKRIYPRLLLLLASCASMKGCEKEILEKREIERW